jgi:hypothetical protein
MYVYSQEYFEHHSREWRKFLLFFSRQVASPAGNDYYRPYEYLGEYHGDFPLTYPVEIGGKLIQANEYENKYVDEE